MEYSKFTYYISIKRIESTAIVVHLCDAKRARELIEDYTLNFHHFDLFTVQKK